jgi:hypothetical protein
MDGGLLIILILFTMKILKAIKEDESLLLIPMGFIVMALWIIYRIYWL